MYTTSKLSERKPTVWTDNEVRLLRRELHLNHPNPIHGHILDVLLTTGLRVGCEALELRRGDLRDDGWVDVVQGKGGRDRRAYFIDGGPDSPTRRMLLEFLDDMGRTNPNDRVFPITRQGFWHALSSRAEDAGIQRRWVEHSDHHLHRIRPHGARHTWVRLARERDFSWDLIVMWGWGHRQALPLVMQHYYEIDAQRELERHNRARNPHPNGPTNPHPGQR